MAQTFEMKIYYIGDLEAVIQSCDNCGDEIGADWQITTRCITYGNEDYVSLCNECFEEWCTRFNFNPRYDRV